MKTKFSHIAAVTFFALTIWVGNVYADGSNKSSSSRNSFGENLETINFISKAETKNTLELFATKTANEETMELESWMNNNDVWNIEFAENFEAGLELEDWMINEDLWHKNEAMFIETISEESLELENWMTNDNVWINGNKISTVFEIDQEETLQVQAWMMNDDIWNK